MVKIPNKNNSPLDLCPSVEKPSHDEHLPSCKPTNSRFEKLILLGKFAKNLCCQFHFFFFAVFLEVYTLGFYLFKFIAVSSESERFF